MRLAAIVLGSLFLATHVARAEEPVGRARQLAAIKAGDDKPIVATFDKDAAILGFVGDRPIGELSEIDRALVGGSPHNTHRMRGMVIALPTPDGGWTVVATHYTADYQ